MSMAGFATRQVGWLDPARRKVSVASSGGALSQRALPCHRLDAIGGDEGLRVGIGGRKAGGDDGFVAFEARGDVEIQGKHLHEQVITIITLVVGWSRRWRHDPAIPINRQRRSDRKSECGLEEFRLSACLGGCRSSKHHPADSI